LLATGLTLVLAACGGGGGGNNDSSSGADSGASSDGGNGAAPTSSTLTADFNGIWKLSCVSEADSVVKEGTTDQFLSLASEFNWELLNGVLVGQETMRVYEAADCSGTALATTVSPVTVVDQGSVEVGGKIAHKVTFTQGAKLSGLGGTTISLNGVTFLQPGKFWTVARVHQDLMYVDGNDLYFGDTDVAAGADGYPAALESTPAMVKVQD
jgi:hypothetical protein